MLLVVSLYLRVMNIGVWIHIGKEALQFFIFWLESRFADISTNEYMFKNKPKWPNIFVHSEPQTTWAGVWPESVSLMPPAGVILQSAINIYDCRLNRIFFFSKSWSNYKSKIDHKIASTNVAWLQSLRHRRRERH